MWEPPVGYDPNRHHAFHKSGYNRRYTLGYGSWYAGKPHLSPTINETTAVFKRILADHKETIAKQRQQNYEQELHIADLTAQLSMNYHAQELPGDFHKFWVTEFKEARWAGSDSIMIVYMLRL